MAVWDLNQKKPTKDVVEETRKATGDTPAKGSQGVWDLTRKAPISQVEESFDAALQAQPITAEQEAAIPQDLPRITPETQQLEDERLAAERPKPKSLQEMGALEASGIGRPGIARTLGAGAVAGVVGPVVGAAEGTFKRAFDVGEFEGLSAEEGAAKTGELAAKRTGQIQSALTGGKAPTEAAQGVVKAIDRVTRDFAPSPVQGLAGLSGQLSQAGQAAKLIAPNAKAFKTLNARRLNLSKNDQQIIDNLQTKETLTPLDSSVVEGMAKKAVNPTVANRVRFAEKNGVSSDTAAAFVGTTKQNRKVLSRQVAEAQAVNTGGDAAKATANRLRPLGQTAKDRWDIVAKVNRDTGSQIDDVAARTLQGEQVDMVDVRQQFSEALSRLGAKVNEETNDIDFSKTSVKDVPGSASLLKKAWKVVRSTEGDALDLHTAKRVLDELVVYGKPSEGLTGASESAVKGLRNSINQRLRSISPEYDQINTKYSETVSALGDFRKAAGKLFDPDDAASTDVLGYLVKDINKETPKSAKMKQALSSLESNAIKYAKIKEFKTDLPTQVLMNDQLEEALKITYRNFGDELESFGPFAFSRSASGKGGFKSAVAEFMFRLGRAATRTDAPDVRTLKALEQLTKEVKK